MNMQRRRQRVSGGRCAGPGLRGTGICPGASCPPGPKTAGSGLRPRRVHWTRTSLFPQKRVGGSVATVTGLGPLAAAYPATRVGASLPRQREQAPPEEDVGRGGPGWTRVPGPRHRPGAAKGLGNGPDGFQMWAGAAVTPVSRGRRRGLQGWVDPGGAGGSEAGRGGEGRAGRRHRAGFSCPRSPGESRERRQRETCGNGIPSPPALRPHPCPRSPPPCGCRGEGERGSLESVRGGPAPLRLPGLHPRGAPGGPGAGTGERGLRWVLGQTGRRPGVGGFG